MEVKPGYKQTEVGLIPEDWNTDLIENLAQITTGSRNAQDRIDDGLYPFFVRSQTIERINSYSYDGEAVLTAGDGVGTGKVFHYINGKFDAHQRVYRISAFNERINGYFFYLYFSGHFYHRIMQMTAKSSVDSVRRDMIAKMLVPLPPTKAEQEAIAEVLSDADALIESLEQLLAKKRHLKQGAMQQLLRPNERWIETSLLAIADGKKELFDDGDWIESDHITDEGVRLIQTGNIGIGQFVDKDDKKYIFETSFTSLRCKEIRTGDLLICRLADPAGRACVLPDIGESKIVTSVDVTIFKPPASAANRIFLANLFSTDEWFRAVSDRSGGTTHKRISRGALGRMKIRLPKVEEQTAIAAILSDMDAEITTLEVRLTKARQLKQGMMQELLTGRIRLVGKAATVVPFPAPQKEVAPASKSHNWQINEAVVVAVLAKHFGSEKFPLGRKRCTKLSYLLHRHVEHVAEGYLKQAAGPYNPSVKYKGPEAIAQKNGYIRPHKTDKGAGFFAAENIAKAETYFTKWYGDDVLKWLVQFRFKTNDELELLATVDMAAEELRKAGTPPTATSVKAIIHDHPQWEAKLDRPIFSDANLARAIKTCESLFA